MQIGWSRSFFIFTRGLRRGVTFLYKVLLTNKVYLEVLCISAKSAGTTRIKWEMKEGRGPKKKTTRPYRRKAEEKGIKTFFFFCFVHFNVISLSAESLTFFLQVHCRTYVRPVLRGRTRACMCARSREHLCMRKQMFCVSPVQQRSAPHPQPPPPSSPLIPFASSPLSQASVLRCHVGDTCVPAAALRNTGHLTKWSPLQPDYARGPAAPNTCL